MRKGELSNEVLPRVFVVFEGLLGVLPDVKASALEALARKRGKWDKAVSYYEISDFTSQGIRDLYWRHRFRVDIITFLGDGFRDALVDELNRRVLMFGDVIAYTEADLMADLTYDRSIIKVLDPDSSHVLRYGGRGQITSPQDLNLMGLIQ